MDAALGSHTSHIIDPRPKTLKNPLVLAERTTLENIRKKKLLLLDNTKLDIGNYRTILTLLQSSLEVNGFQQIELVSQTIRGKRSVQIGQMADLAAALAEPYSVPAPAGAEPEQQPVGLASARQLPRPHLHRTGTHDHHS